MPATEARVQTPRAERYLNQLTDHLGRLQHGSTRHGQPLDPERGAENGTAQGHAPANSAEGGHGGGHVGGRHVGGGEVGGGHAGPPVVRHVERSRGHARIDFDWGTLVLTATAAELVLHVHTDDAQALVRGEELIERRVETIGRREHLTLTWHPTTAS